MAFLWLLNFTCFIILGKRMLVAGRHYAVFQINEANPVAVSFCFAVSPVSDIATCITFAKATSKMAR